LEGTNKMRITKSRLKQIILEELENKIIDDDFRLSDNDGPFVLGIPSAELGERFFRVLRRDRGGNHHPEFGSLENAHRYRNVDKAMDRKYMLKEYGLDSVEIMPREDWDASELEEVRAPFPAGSRVKHEDYGEGVVTHAGTKNTNVAVKFDKEGRDGKKNRQVSRGSLKRAKK